MGLVCSVNVAVSLAGPCFEASRSVCVLVSTEPEHSSIGFRAASSGTPEVASTTTRLRTPVP